MLASVTIPAVAANWEPVARSNSATFYVDTSSIAHVGDIVKVWTKFANDKPLVDTVGRAPTAYSLNRFAFNCAARAASLMQFSRYDKAGSVTVSYSWPDYDFQGVVPDSANEAIMKRVCQ